MSFQDNGVVPDSIESRDAFADPDRAESRLMVQRDRGPILVEDRSLQCLQTGFVGGDDQGESQGLAHPAPDVLPAEEESVAGRARADSASAQGGFTGDA